MRKILEIRLEKTLWEQLTKIAAHENRSFSNLIETYLKPIAENHSIIRAKGRKKKK